MPSPLSSQTKSTGIRSPAWSYHPAVLKAAVALAWLTEASPKEQTTIASGGQGACVAPAPLPTRTPAPVRRPALSSRRSRSTASPIPTARGRCEAMVEVVGTMARSARPNTLCRPPAIGSRLDAAIPRSTSRAASAYAANAFAAPVAAVGSVPAGSDSDSCGSEVVSGSRVAAPSTVNSLSADRARSAS
ncbi:hypothetical protein GUI43_05269 [Micromonospora noduli]|nr:hypothetical protein GUI43_05269 [Micromonospora noduli]